ncbi:extracellular solute-binding protein [Marinobacterium sp. D7]|uniref:ABC transporter substrate-binding protein n=1 Tax=Marinobacterium ramblicola TaxID=2849041 RepID=UPI001C2D8F19|nr:extracellular solute-binding protein [Marinobacterium ramblicola]MBV1790290.1 extracellular solute-binding protein [Marinobacterium ramblicola]
MTTSNLTRRHFLGLAAGLAGALYSPVSLAADNRLRFMWWGSRERAELTRNALAAFTAANPGAAVDTEYLDWLDYWQRFVSLVAIRQTPDLIQMDYRYLKLYANNGVLLPLDRYLGNRLDIDSFGQHNIDSCRVDGKLYGVNLGINSTAAVVDREGWAAAGVEPPSFGTDWEAFRDKCEAFAKGNRQPNYYATPDAGGITIAFENWLRQRGKGLYDSEGQLGFETADAVEWFRYWADIRAFGGCVPADIQVLDKHSIETSVLILGFAAMDFAHSNMLLNYQQRIARPLDITAFPADAGGLPGHYYKPSQMLSVGAGSTAPDLAVELANFLVMSPEAVRILGVDRGIPASPAMREVLSPQLNEVDRKTIDYIDKLAPWIGPLPPTPPLGAGEVTITLQGIGHEIAFGHLTPKQGGEKLIRDAAAILSK